MEISPLPIDGAWVITPRQHGDPRGLFLEWFKDSVFESVTGIDFRLRQANCSVSARGTVRGIHYADVPPGQAKYITCLSGHVRDMVVDIRVGSPTFGRAVAVDLDAADRRAVYLAEGLGHGFCAVEDASMVAYLCSTEYAPDREREVNPLDPALALDWGLPTDKLQLSAKDAAAPSLEEARAASSLPDYASCLAFLRRTPVAD